MDDVEAVNELVTVAHRAGNDLTALRSVPAGDHVLEVDVRVFRSRLEARHLKTVGPVRVYWDRWELRGPSTPVLLFDELLRTTASPLMVDLKGTTRELSRLVTDALEDRESTTWICSRYWKSLEAVAGRPGTRVVASVGHPAQLRRVLSRYRPGTLDGVSVDQRLLDAAVVAELRARFGQVFTWRVNDEATARRLLDVGVNGLITDRFDLLEAFAAMGAGQELVQRPSADHQVTEQRNGGTGDGIDDEVVGGRDDGPRHRRRKSRG